MPGTLSWLCFSLCIPEQMLDLNAVATLPCVSCGVLTSLLYSSLQVYMMSLCFQFLKSCMPMEIKAPLCLLYVLLEETKKRSRSY